MAGQLCVSHENSEMLNKALLTSIIDTATVDYDTRAQARHIFRLAAMTEKPISVAGAELAIAENDMEYESSLSLPPAFNGLRELSPLTQGFRKSLPSNRCENLQ